MRIVITLMLLCGLALADEPPAALSNIDRLELRARVSELRAIEAEIRVKQMEIDALKQSAQPVLVARDAICKRYQIDPAQVGKTVFVDLETGKVTRAPTPRATR